MNGTRSQVSHDRENVNERASDVLEEKAFAEEMVPAACCHRDLLYNLNNVMQAIHIGCVLHSHVTLSDCQG